MADAPIIVYPPDAHGARRVRADGAILGRASNVNDVLSLLGDAGFDPDEIALDGPLIEWRGGGAYAWDPGEDDEE
ncbi:hypothetical protein ABZ820_20580 [Streptomyces diacarni]|uniref:Uncharacterized protein n=1 Tax=Streptomyces diacarni TaxID=2800381 RepID=A0A367FD73_9ACTN|nr:hypothetical protein [Streptomyces diacarni]RCG27540.1 hypothetical protein DTL70_04155 [Streptomyces diacarni]